MLRTLKGRTALAAAFLAALGIAAVTSLQSSLSERTVLASTVSQHEDYTERVAADIDRQLRLARSSLSELAGNIDGGQLKDARALHYFLTSRIGIQQSFESIIVYGTDGRAIASRPSLALPPVAREPWFQAALRDNGTPTLRKPFFSPLSAEPSVALTYPAHDAQGVLRAIVVGTLVINQDQLMLSPSRSAKSGGNFILLTPELDLVMHPEPTYVTKPLYAVDPSAEIIQQGLELPSQTIIGPNHRGVRSLYAFRPVQSAGWMLVGVAANEEAYASLSLLSRQMLLAGSLLAALLIPAMWLLVSRMLRPLDHLRREMRKLRNGTSDAPMVLNLRATHELRQLAEEFAGMAAAWQTAESALQHEKERAEVTLHSIADGVIATSANGRVASMNRAAEVITGWRNEDAIGLPFDTVFRLRDERSGAPLPDPVTAAMQQGGTVGTSGGALMARDGSLTPIDHSAAPIHTDDGSIDGAVLVFRNVAAERKAAQELEWRATHDTMTGLVNRAGYEQALQALFRPGAGAEQGPHALLMLDLDEFKIVNDTCGHAAGDELLKQLSSLLLAESRRSDTVARLGGDEFAVLMYHCSGEQATRVAEDLRTTIAAFRFGWSGRVFHVGASFGVVEINPSFCSAAEVQKAADMACYMAKRAGRNRVCVHSSEREQVEAVRSEMSALGIVRSAIADNRLRLFAQSISPARAQAAAGCYFEVLVRMLDEAGRIVPPGAFLPAAERYGLMGQLDRWVVANAARASAARFGPDRWHELDTMSINLSARTLHDPDIGDFIIEQLRQHGVPFPLVCFEVTETAAIENPQQVAHLMRRLRLQGVRFALDDFGVGMTSLAQLRDLPIDVLKIDGSFVHHIHEHGVNASLVEAIQTIAHRLSMKTIAERVETEQERAHLQALGIDYLQGYLLARPGPIEQVIGIREAAVVVDGTTTIAA